MILFTGEKRERLEWQNIGDRFRNNNSVERRRVLPPWMYMKQGLQGDISRSFLISLDGSVRINCQQPIMTIREIGMRKRKALIWLAEDRLGLEGDNCSMTSWINIENEQVKVSSWLMLVRKKNLLQQVKSLLQNRVSSIWRQMQLHTKEKVLKRILNQFDFIFNMFYFLVLLYEQNKSVQYKMINLTTNNCNFNSSSKKKTLNQSSSSFASAMKALQVQYAQIDQKCQIQQQQTDEMEKQYTEQLINQEKRYEKQICNLKSDNEETQRLLDEQIKQNMRIKSDFVLVEGQKNNYEQDLNRIQSFHDQQIKVYKEQVNRLQMEMNNEKESYQNLFLMYDDVKQERDKLKINNTIIDEKIENIKKDQQIEQHKKHELKQIEQETKQNFQLQMDQEKLSFNQQITSFQKEIKISQQHFQQQIENLKQEKNDLYVKNQQQEIQLQTKQEEQNTLNKRIEDLQNGVKQLQEIKQQRNTDKKNKIMKQTNDIFENQQQFEQKQKEFEKEEEEQKKQKEFEEELKGQSQTKQVNFKMEKNEKEIIEENLKKLNDEYMSLQKEYYCQKDSKMKMQIRQQMVDMNTQIGREGERLTANL